MTATPEPIVALDEFPEAPVETERKCSKCDVTKPIDDFYRQDRGRGGRMAHCIGCNNKRPPTKIRLIRNRARARAFAILAQRHAAEFDEIFTEQREAAEREYRLLQVAAAGNHDAAVPRLRPGPVREGESKLDRLDIARCLRCHTHHDAEHECPECGGITPEVALSEKPWEVRQWARDHGVTVPRRGPVPDRVLAAFRAAHPEATPEAEDVGVDETAVERRFNGDRTVRLNVAEKRLLVNRARQAGWSYRDITVRTGLVKVERYVEREVVAS